MVSPSNNQIGFLNLKKPQGITSHDLVNKVRRIAGLKRVGHAGTLDPMAEGVMVVGLSTACRLLQYLPDDKSYLGEVLLGTRTDTDDLEGKVLEKVEPCPQISEKEIIEKVSKFVGPQLQIPPLYSAIKQGGRKLYEMARKGEAPRELPGRKVEIYKCEVVEIVFPVVTLRIACSKGTYIRSIARDLGNQLEVGGCLQSLIRESSGKFLIENSHSLEELEKGNLQDFIVTPQDALGLKTIEVDTSMAKRIANGQVVSLDDLNDPIEPEQSKVLVNCQAKTVALMKRVEPACLGPEVVLTNASHF